MLTKRAGPARCGMWAPVLLLTLVTAVWGWTFVVVRDAVAAFPVTIFLGLRFGLAAACLLPMLLTKGTGVRAGVLPGLALSAGYLFQTTGLKYTTASKAGLLTGLFVVFTPLLEVVCYRLRPRWYTVIAVPLALAGTILLTSGIGASTQGRRELLGDGLEVLTAFFFSIHMLLLGRLTPTIDARRAALGQMVIAAGLFVALSAAAHPAPHLTPSVAWAVIITGILASAAAFYIQTSVQQRISPSRTAMILVTEPAFALFFGVILAGDAFTVSRGAGAALILGVLVFHEVAASRGDVSLHRSAST